MVMAGRPVSWNYSDPATPTSQIDNVLGYTSSLDLFNKIFVPAGTGPAPRAPIVDRVLASYNRLRNGSSRLSAADKQRLDDHIARIAELQRKLTAGGASCSNVATPTDNANKHNGNSPAEAARQLELFNEVAAAAFMCGTSRIAVLCYGDTSRFVSYGGDWHQEVAHQWQLADKQALLVQSYQRFFETVLVDMANRLDRRGGRPAPPFSTTRCWSGPRRAEWRPTARSRCRWSPSAARRGASTPACCATTGEWGTRPRSSTRAEAATQTLGLLYNQWLATVLQAMHVPPSEFERWGHKGYGVPYMTKESWTPPYAKHYGDTSSRYFQMASDFLPFLKA